jgi:hypothetical protein
MCPACITTAMLIAGSFISTGGVAAIVIKKLGGKNATDKYIDKESNHVSSNDERPQDWNT